MDALQDLADLPPLEVVPPRTPRWLWPAVMAAVTLAALGASLRWPAHGVFWWFVPYTFVGNSLAMIPYDWYIPAYVQSYPAWSAVLLGVLGTVVIEFWNMELLQRLLAREGTARFRGHHVTRRLVRWYARAPWLTLVAAGLLPIIPFYPCRILATLARYPMARYQLAVVVGRAVRYAGLAGLGLLVPIPPRVYFLFGALFVAAVAWRTLAARRRTALSPS